MPVLRLFAAAREAAGLARDDFDASSVGALLTTARDRYGDSFATVLATARVWVNGQPADDTTELGPNDVVAVLPPVSGGSAATRLRPPAQSLPADEVIPPTPPPPSPPGAPLPPPAAATPARVVGAPEASHVAAAVPPGLLAAAPPPVAPPPVAPLPPVMAQSAPPVEPPQPPRPPARPAGEGPGPEASARSPFAPPLETADPDTTSPQDTPSGGTRTRSPERPVLAPPPLVRVLDPQPRRSATTIVGAPSDGGAVLAEESPGIPPEGGADDGAADAERPMGLMSRGWLGLAWTLATATAAVGGPSWLAVWLAIVGAAAAAQLAVSGRSEPRRPLLVAAAATVAALLPLAALGGGRALALAVGAGVLVTLLGRAGSKTARSAAEGTRVLAGAVLAGGALAALVILCGESFEATLFLLAAAAAYDTGAYLIGTGASSWWEGPAAGMAAVLPVALFAESWMGSFQGIQLGVVAAGLAPVGPLVAKRMLAPGVPEWRTPTLRRIDSLLVLAPIWVVFALQFLESSGTAAP